MNAPKKPNSDPQKIRKKNSIYYRLDKTELYHGITACLSNSRTLFNSAEKIAETTSGHGVANSLLILAGEECVKGYVLLAVFVSIELEFEIEPYFRRHAVKHMTGKEVLKIIKIISLSITLFSKGSKSKRGDTLLEISEMIFGNEKSEKWWDAADDQKKNGFYVDFKNGKFHSPVVIEPMMYKDSCQMVGKYIKSLSMIENLKPDDYKLFSNKLKGKASE